MDPLKILFVHCYYQQKGGEDAVFLGESALLNRTEEVKVLTFQNKTGWRGGIQFALSLWNPTALRKIKKQIRVNRPDVIHLHNWHFSTGPAIIRVAKKQNIPVVLTLHNYRLLCPSATLSHQGKLFTASIRSSFPWKAVAAKVYRNSFLQTFWLGFVIWFHKRIGTWRQVDKYIVLTGFAKSIFSNAVLDIPFEKFVIKPNFVNLPDGKAGQHDDDSALFIGRLCEEKGINVLLDAFRISGDRIAIAGEGPLKDAVISASEGHKNIHYIGTLDRPAVEQAMKEHEVLIFPSTWYEGMPLTILEAFASGLPVIASNLGAMDSMIRHGYNGLHFEAGNAADLADKLSQWQALTVTQKGNFRKNAYDTYLEHYTPEKNKESLLEIYHSVANG